MRGSRDRLARRRRLSAAHRRRGFSMVDVMVSAAVLGVALIAVVNVHVGAMRAVSRNRQLTVANQILAQRGDQLAAQRPEATLLPSCPRGPGPVGCRATNRQLAPAKSCTAWLSGPDVPTPSGGNPNRNPEGLGYRLDLVIADHPDSANQSGAFLASLSVCWQDEAGQVQEIQTWRLLVPGA